MRSRVVGAVAICVAAACAKPAPPDGPVVRIPQGAYRGRPADQGVVAFLGIPYARPPIGRLRSREAMPPEPSALLVDAPGYEPPRRQLPDDNEPASLRREDEDCLSLNIWTRQVEGPPKPVLLK